MLIIERLAERGAEGIITGCTEIELLVTSDDAGLPYIPPGCTPRPPWSWRPSATQIYRSGGASATRLAIGLPPISAVHARLPLERRLRSAFSVRPGGRRGAEGADGEALVGQAWRERGEPHRDFVLPGLDGDLTERGKRQARELAGRLAAAGRADPVGLLACSPLRRARQTAQIAGSQLGLPDAWEVDDLRELNVGLLDGRSDTHAWHTYHQVLAAWRAGHTHVRFPGGEDRNELCIRLRRALLAIADRSAGTTSLVVAHGGSLRAALPCLAVEADPGTDLPLGAVATMRIDPSHPHSAITLLSWPATSPPGAPA